MFHYENGSLIVARYQKILTLNEKEIRIIFKSFNLLITGYDLRITYLEDIELKLAGEIKEIAINRIK